MKNTINLIFAVICIAFLVWAGASIIDILCTRFGSIVPSPIADWNIFGLFV